MLYAASALVIGSRDLELELVVLAGMIHAEAEQARDRLRSEPRPRGQAAVDRGDPNRLRSGSQPGERDEPGVELANRHRRVRVGDRDRASETRDDDC